MKNAIVSVISILATLLITASAQAEALRVNQGPCPAGTIAMYNPGCPSNMTEVKRFFCSMPDGSEVLTAVECQDGNGAEYSLTQDDTNDSGMFDPGDQYLLELDPPDQEVAANVPATTIFSVIGMPLDVGEQLQNGDPVPVQTVVTEQQAEVATVEYVYPNVQPSPPSGTVVYYTPPQIMDFLGMPIEVLGAGFVTDEQGKKDKPVLIITAEGTWVFAPDFIEVDSELYGGAQTPWVLVEDADGNELHPPKESPRPSTEPFA